MTENEKLDLILSETREMKTEMQEMKSDITGMKTEMREMKSDITGMKTEMREMKSDITDIKSDVTDVKHKVTKLGLTIENEIRVNSQRVAEGHLDLSRNLHDAMRPSNEVEMLAIRVRRLETDVKDLKERIS